MAETTFRGWLEDALERHDVSRRELARRLADGPAAGDPKSYRRSICRILRGDVSPTQATRDSIQDALDDHTAPSVDDESGDQGMSREVVLEELRRGRRNLLRLERALTNGRF